MCRILDIARCSNPFTLFTLFRSLNKHRYRWLFASLCWQYDNENRRAQIDNQIHDFKKGIVMEEVERIFSCQLRARRQKNGETEHELNELTAI